MHTCDSCIHNKNTVRRKKVKSDEDLTTKLYVATSSVSFYCCREQTAPDGGYESSTRSNSHQLYHQHKYQPQDTHNEEQSVFLSRCRQLLEIGMCGSITPFLWLARIWQHSWRRKHASLHIKHERKSLQQTPKRECLVKLSVWFTLQVNVQACVQNIQSKSFVTTVSCATMINMYFSGCDCLNEVKRFDPLCFTSASSSQRNFTVTKCFKHATEVFFSGKHNYAVYTHVHDS